MDNNALAGNSREGGSWLLKDGKIITLFDRLVDGANVSPDGRTIVYTDSDFNPEYVQAVDLCASGKG